MTRFIPAHRALRIGSLLMVGLLLVVSSGCSLFDQCSLCKPSEPPPAPPQSINHVLTIWDPRVFTAADTQQRGRTMPGLAGRVYLLSEESKKMEEATGRMFVEMYDVTAVPAGGEAKKLVEWNFDPASLKKLLREDQIGKGYTLFLPWETYQPEVKQIKLQLAYVEPNGAPHYAEPTMVTLKSFEPVTIQNQTLVPGLRQVSEKK